jgi:hypothetical protein
MKRILIMFLCIAALGMYSCEDKERLDEIKAELKAKNKKAEKSDEEEKPKVSISAPSQNEPPAPEESMDMGGDYGGEYGGGDYYDDSYDDSGDWGD